MDNSDSYISFDSLPVIDDLDPPDFLSEQPEQKSTKIFNYIKNTHKAIIFALTIFVGTTAGCFIYNNHENAENPSQQNLNYSPPVYLNDDPLNYYQNAEPEECPANEDSNTSKGCDISLPGTRCA